jgi:hypothetical protein
MYLEGKNCSFRKLVGLRWWNEVKEDGSEEWIFESDHEIRGTSIDTSIFWFSLYILPIFWGIILFLDIISFKWMWAIAAIIAMTLTGSNMIGYYKCSNEQKKKISSFIFEKGAAGFTNLFMSNNK